MLTKIAFLALAAATLAGCAPKHQTHIASPEPTETAAAVAKAPALPPLHAEDLLELEAITSNRFVLADKPGEIQVRIHLKAKTRKDAKRPPINLGLVVDTSGSMEGAAIEDARKASVAMLDALSEGDRLSLVVFNSTSQVLVPSTILDKKSIAEIREKIGGMKASGTTDLAGGLAGGLSQVQSYFQANGINRVVLLGDGVPNDPSQLPYLAQNAAQQHISITALGLGLEYDETLMSHLALNSGGKYHFIRESAQVAKVFSDEVLRLQQVAGRSIVVSLTPGPGVVIKDVIGLPVQRSGAPSFVNIGDLSEGEERDVLVRATVPAHHPGLVVELLDAEVSMDNLQMGGQRLSLKAFVSAKSSADAAEIEQGRQKDVQHAVARLSVADAIVKAVAAARQGDVPLGKSLLDAAEKEAKAAAKEYDDAELAEKVKTIGPLRKSLPQLAPPPPPVNANRGAKPSAGGPAQPDTAPAPAPMAPATAAMVMKSQAEAMTTIQGQ